MRATHFKHRSLYKYTRVAKGQDRVGIKSMIDLVLVKKDIQRHVQDEGGERDGTKSLKPLCCTV